MIKKETYRQHYVPRTYLKRFSLNRRNEFFINAVPLSNLEEKRIYEANIAKICFEKNIYTLLGDTEEKRMLIENFYSENYETYYDKIYNILTDPNKKSITEEERELIISTVVTMFYRTSRWMNIHNDLVERSFYKIYGLCKQTGQDSFKFGGQNISIIGKTVKQLIKEYKIESRPIQAIEQLRIAFKLIRLRKASDAIYVIKLNDTDYEFITSDHPVTYSNINEGKAIPFDPTNILSIALDNKHRLYLMPESDKATSHIISRTYVTGTACSLETLMANHDQFRNAERFLLGTSSSLIDYLKSKVIIDTKLSDEEMKKLTSMEELLDKGKELGLFK
jgi:hypothetical protein